MRSWMQNWACCSILIIVTGLPSCLADERTDAKGKAEADVLYADYQSWKAVNSEPKFVKGVNLGLCAPKPPPGESRSPHDNGFINIYVNPVGRDLYVKEKNPKFEVGTVIVKEKLKKKGDKGPLELGVMIKRDPGYNAGSGDWQFLFVDQKGKVVERKDMGLSCAGCHRMRAKQDYVFQKVASTPEKK